MFDTFKKIAYQRYSLRTYSEKPVEREKIEKMIDIARFAPSACNSQPWRFIVVDDPKMKKELCDKGLGIAVPNTFAKKAPVIIVACAEKKFMVHDVAARVSGVDYEMLDMGAAIENMLLAAVSLGLGTCWLGWFREKAIKKLLDIPRSLKVVSLITVGYPPEENIPEKSRIEKIKILSYNKYKKI